MKLNLEKFMQSMPKGKNVEDPEDPRIKKVNEVLLKQGLRYDPVQKRVFLIASEKMKRGPLGDRFRVPEEAMRDYLRNEGLLETSAPIPTKRANLSDMELRKRGFRKDPKSGDIFPINL